MSDGAQTRRKGKQEGAMNGQNQGRFDDVRDKVLVGR